MANVAIQSTVGDYAQWRPLFDKHKTMRREKAGVTSEQVYRNADNPKQVLIWFDVSDPKKALQVIQSDEVKAAMKEAGVVGAPKVHVIP